MPSKYQPSEVQRAVLFGLCLLVLLLFCAVIFWPSLSGSLLLDDFWNLEALGNNGGVNNLDNFVNFVFGNLSGPSGRPVAMLSFLIDGQNWPIHTRSFKYTNLMIHFLNGVTLCWLALLLFRNLSASKNTASIFSLLLAAAWILHPLNVSTTFYVIQRMTQLMTLFTLASLICYVKGRSLVEVRPRKGFMLLCLALFPFGLLAVLSKENGALLLLLIVCFEATIFAKTRRNKWFQTWYRLGVLLPLFIVIAYVAFNTPESLPTYDFRHFTLIERLLTEPRILWTYLFEIFIPDTTGKGLYHDDIIVSTSFLQPITTILSISGLIFALYFAISLRNRQPVFSLAVFWFFSLHLLESTFLPLELYFEHRNYLAMIGPLLALVWYAGRFVSQSPEVWKKQGMSLLIVLFMSTSVLSCWFLSNLWSDNLLMHMAWSEKNPKSFRATDVFAEQLDILGLHDEAIDTLTSLQESYPNEASVMIQRWNVACANGLPAPFDLSEITNNEQLENYWNNIHNHLEKFLKHLIDMKCDYPDQEVMIKLFERLVELPVHEFTLANLHVSFSDLYLTFGQLEAALTQLRKANELAADAGILIKQSIMVANVGAFEVALSFLDRAREIDANRRRFTPSRLTEIERLEVDFKRLLNRDRVPKL